MSQSDGKPLWLPLSLPPCLNLCLKSIPTTLLIRIRNTNRINVVMGVVTNQLRHLLSYVIATLPESGLGWIAQFTHLSPRIGNGMKYAYLVALVCLVVAGTSAQQKTQEERLLLS